MRNATDDLTAAFAAEPPMVKVSRAAELTGFCAKTIQRACKSGRLQATKGGKDYRIPISALRRWLEKGIS